MTDILCGTPDRHILVPRAPPKLDGGSSNGYQTKLLAKCLVHVFRSRKKMTVLTLDMMSKHGSTKW